MKRIIKTVAWAIRHPQFATCWYMFGQGYSTMKGLAKTLTIAAVFTALTLTAMAQDTNTTVAPPKPSGWNWLLTYANNASIWSNLQTTGDSLVIDGAYTALTDGERGFGIVTHVRLFEFNTGHGTQFGFGPAHGLFWNQNKEAISTVEFGVSDKVVDGAVFQKWLAKVPVLGLPFGGTKPFMDVTGLYAYVGGGTRADKLVFGGTAGIGGIHF